MNDAINRFGQLDTSSPLLHWVLASFAAYVLGAHILWLLRSRILWRSPYRELLEEASRFLFFLGVPYLVLGGWPRPPLSGLLSLEDLGLLAWGPLWPASRWLQAAGNGLALGLAALAILILAWANASRASEQGGNDPGPCFSPRPWWLLVLDVLYLEVHWAFYRTALTLLLDDAYVGVFVGLGLVYVQWGLNPLWRRGWRKGSQAASRWLRSAMALIAALIFLVTRNLWVCLVVHGLIEMTLRWMGTERELRGGLQSPDQLNAGTIL